MYEKECIKSARVYIYIYKVQSYFITNMCFIFFLLKKYKLDFSFYNIYIYDT
jgi:hypothetical protein